MEPDRFSPQFSHDGKKVVYTSTKGGTQNYGISN